MSLISNIKHHLRPAFHSARSHYYAVLHGYPAKDLKIIAVTGTDGKTTTCNMIYHVLKESGVKVALASTVWFATPKKGQYRNKTKMTSLPPRSMQKFLKECREEKVEYVIVEASSIALHQKRIAGMRPSIACLTNITREELAYHRTMEHYEECKRKIMWGAEFAVLPSAFAHWENGVTKVHYYHSENIPANTLQMEGSYNYENAAVVFEVGRILKISEEKILNGLKTFQGIVGRMQRVPDTKGRHIFVDYALTPGAFEAIYDSTRKNYPEGKIIHVFGSAGGGRDTEKRPILGEIASRYADTIILTDDESYGEPLDQILDMIESGIPDTFNGEVVRIENRMDAFKKALEIAKEGDVVLATGMGGEMSRNVVEGDGVDSLTTAKLKGQDISWEEEKILAELAKKY